MKKILLNRDYPLEERMVFFIYLTLIISNIVVIVMNIMDNIPFGKNYKWFAFMLFVALIAWLYWNKVNSRRTIRNISFIIILYIIYPALFIFSGGLRTASGPYMIILLLALVYSFRGKIRITMVVSYILMSLGLMLLFYLQPDIFPYVSDETMYLDWVMNFPVIMGIIAVMSFWISSEHDFERKKAMTFSKEMEELSKNDSLTGIFNRRYLEDRVSEMADSKNDVLLFIFDIDRFKLINDTHGHAEGDRILVNVAKIMTNVFPEMTSIRFGGDEFLVMGSCGKSDDIHEKVRRFQKLIEWELGVTISGGIVKFDGSLADSLNRGDKLLYEAKTGGRNKVIIEE